MKAVSRKNQLAKPKMVFVAGKQHGVVIADGRKKYGQSQSADDN
jgi:hypothetical protein